MSTTIKKTMAALALIAAGYLAGATLPEAAAYTEDTTQIGNQIVTELAGIKRAIERIESRIR